MILLKNRVKLPNCETAVFFAADSSICQGQIAKPGNEPKLRPIGRFYYSADRAASIRTNNCVSSRLSLIEVSGGLELFVLFG